MAPFRHVFTGLFASLRVTLGRWMSYSSLIGVLREVGRTMTVAEERAAPAALRRVVSPQLVGRSRELETLAATLAAAPSLAIIEGEAGMGKSRLVAELAEQGSLAGRRWLVGACRRVREPFPMGPVIEALRGLGEALQGARLSPVAGALRPLVPELEPWLPLAPEPLDDRAAERHRVFRALTEVLDTSGPTVLVLEDLHWADEQTVEFLTYLLAEAPENLAVLVTYRSEDVEPGVRASVATVPSDVRRAYVELAPLDTGQTADLAMGILNTDQMSTEFAEHLRARSSGVPFAIEELLALLRARGTLVKRGGRWERNAIDELDVPSGIRDPILERASRLPHGARRLVDAASVLQELAPMQVLLTVAGTDPADAVEAVEAALAAGLLVERGDRIGFRHPIAAQAVYEALSAVRRVDLHARAASALELLTAGPLGQIAHHLKCAGSTDAWVVAAEQAADQAIELGNDEEAARQLQDVLRNTSIDPADRGRLAIKLGRAAHETFQSSMQLIDLMSEVLKLDLPRTTRGELAFWTSTAVQDAGGDPQRKRQLLLEAARNLDELPDLHAWAMVGLGIATHPGVPVAEHRRWLDKVLDVLPQVDDPAFAVFLRGKVAMTLIHVGDPSWAKQLRQIEDQVGGMPRRRREVNAYMSVGMLAGYTGRYPEAERLLASAREGAVACGSTSLEAMIRCAQALVDCCRGRWDGLESEVTSLLDELGEAPLARVDVELALAVLQGARGELEAAWTRLRAVAAQLEAMNDLDLLALAVSAMARIAVARNPANDTDNAIDEALARIDRLLATIAAKELWAPVARVLPSGTQLLIAAGRGSDARALVERCTREWAELDIPLAPAVLRHTEGIIASADERWAEAVERLLESAAVYEQLECPYEAAHARETTADALAQVGDARAGDEFRSALGTYQRLGASCDASRCARLARSHGIRLPVPHRGGRKGYGDSLSPREEEVGRLVAAGLSNKEVGAKLFLSPATVEKHLGRVMRKLGVRSRSAVAARLLAGRDDAASG